MSSVVDSILNILATHFKKSSTRNYTLQDHFQNELNDAEKSKFKGIIKYIGCPSGKQ